MDKDLHQQLVKDTNALRDLVGASKTESIVGMWAAKYLLPLTKRVDDVHLVSPAKQADFLLGLLLSTPEPTAPSEFGGPESKKAASLLNDIFGAYSLMFFPAQEGKPTEAVLEAQHVAMPAFLHYFNMGLLASAEQVRSRITRYISPFDEELHEAFGLTATEALTLAESCLKTVRASMDRYHAAIEEVERVRIAMTKWGSSRDMPQSQFQAEVVRQIGRPAFMQLAEAQSKVLKISLEALTEEFGKRLAEAFWKTFLGKRGEVSNFFYLTERNIAEEKCFFETGPGVAICLTGNRLFTSILFKFERYLMGASNKVQFFQNRDKKLEEEVVEILLRLFADTAIFHRNAVASGAEHDLIVIWERRMFIFEAKASPPTEPFRDPEKAFIRIKRSFGGDRGIQKSFEQASALRNEVLSGQDVALSNAAGEPLATLRSNDFDAIYCISVTRDDFGPLAVNLSFLLEKEDNEPYPWAVNVLDLENLIDAWRHFDWGPGQLCKFLDGRARLHGKLYAADELQVAGFFIRHGGFDFLLNNEANILSLESDYSDIFDEIYMANKEGRKVELKIKRPHARDLRKSLGSRKGMKARDWARKNLSRPT